MPELVQFPGLGLEFHLNKIALSVFGLRIHWYGVIVVTGMLLAVAYAMKRCRTFGITPEQVSDVALYAIIGGMVGARAYYVVFSWDYYQDHLNEIIRIWEGGIAIYGGIIGGVLTGYVLCRLWKIKKLSLLDLAAGALLLGQGIGRWGNFVNVEAFGSNTTLPWGMTGPSVVSYLTSKQAQLAQFGVSVDPAVPVHPTFFYESVWCFAGFLFIAWYTKRRRYNGELILMYCAWYGLGRFWIEGLRTDSLMLGPVRVSQLLAGAGALAAFAVLLWMNRRVKSGTLPSMMRLAAARNSGQDQADPDTASSERAETSAGAAATQEKAPGRDEESEKES